MYTFVPAIRHGQNEEKAFKKFYDELDGADEDLEAGVEDIKPLVEIVSDDDIENIGKYTRRFDEVFVDLPRYLTNRDNEHKENIEDLLSEYSSDIVDFYIDNQEIDFTPIVSGEIDPIDHSSYSQMIQGLKSEFDRICVRLFIPVDEFSSAQEREIENILELLRENDAVILDVVDIRELDRGIRPNIETITEMTEDRDIYIFDLFEPRGEVNYNYGLVMTKHTEADGVGDFVIEPRFANYDDIPDVAFQNIPRRIHQYEHTDHTVTTKQDSDKYLQAVEEMLNQNILEPNHCPFCEALVDEYRTVKSDPDRKDLGAGFVKQMRMNHYMYSVLANEFEDMASAMDAEGFDEDGFEDII